MTAFPAWIRRVKANPYFVTAWTLFAGALGEQVSEAVQSGHMNFTAKGVEGMLWAAAGTTIVALTHLYITPQKPTTPPDAAQPK